jgi:hypothetical protein
MKTHNQYSLPGLLIILFFTASSCSIFGGDDEIKENQLIGRWEVLSAVFNSYEDGKLVNSSGIGAGTNNNRPEFKTWITFDSDNTYRHTNQDGNSSGLILSDVIPREGEWRLSEGNSVLNLSSKEMTVENFSGKKMKLSAKDDWGEIILEFRK